MERNGGSTSEILLCLGLALTGAWWLFLGEGLGAALPTGSSWLGAAVMHAAGLITACGCLAWWRRVARWMDRPLFFAVIGTATAVFSGALLAMASQGCPEGSMVATALAAAGGCMAFQGYVRMLAKRVGTSSRMLSLLLLSMALAAVFWLVLMQLPPQCSMLFGVVAQPLAAGLAWRVPLESAGQMAWASREGSPCQWVVRVVREVLPLFLITILLYEAVLGAVTGLASASGMMAPRVLYTAAMVVVAVACVIFGRTERFSVVLGRLVMPLISLALLALALTSIQNSVLAMSLTLMGSTLFEAAYLSYFARTAIDRRVEPLIGFLVASIVSQFGILAFYLVSPVLVASEQMVLAGVALVLLFLLIVIESARSLPLLTSPGAHGAVRQHAHGGPCAGVAPSMAQMLHQACTTYAQERGFSARETEVLELAVCGKNLTSISAELCVAPSTVKTHFRNMYRKAGAADRQALIRDFDRYRHDT